MRVWIKGAGDIASGIALRLLKCGASVMMTETERPTTVRRMAAFSRAVYEPDHVAEVEGVRARLVENRKELEDCLGRGEAAVITDPQGAHQDWYRPDVLIDAVLAKKNTGTSAEQAPLVIGVGPGFTAGADCHYVVETMRGHTLGRVIEKGSALPNTGIPGEVGGFTIERLIKAEADGTFVPVKEIGERVEKGETVAFCGTVPVKAKMSGLIRGMLPDAGLSVKQGMKCGDIDASAEEKMCYMVSDKALAVAGGVLEAILRTYPLLQEEKQKRDKKTDGK